MKNKTFLFMIFILLIVILISSVIFSLKYKSDSYQKEYLVFIESKKKETENMVSYNVFLGDSFKDKFVMKIYVSDSIDISKYVDLKYGDVLSIKGKIVVPEYMNNPGEFNYKHYLYSNNIYGEISVSKINGIEEYTLNFKEKILSYIYNYKEYLGHILEKYMSYERASLAKSIIYGETIDLDEQAKLDFSEAGLSHLMAISGSNITSIITVLSAVFLLLKVKGKVVKIIIVLAILIFVILTGSSLSTLRAGIMATSAIIASMLNKRIHPLKSWLLAIILILLYAPFSIYNVGCILSFLATLGIILFLKPLSSLSKKIVDNVKINWLKKVGEIIFLNFWLVISVQIMILPVQINSFNLISLTQIIFNVLVSGISNIITILGAIFVMFPYIPILNLIEVKIIDFSITLLMNLINIFKNISINISVMDLPLEATVLYYIFIFSFLLRIYLKEFANNRKYELNKKSWKKYYFVQSVLLVLLVVAVVVNNMYFIYIDSFIYFFNVGQGDMSYIKSKTNSVIVDIGSLKTNLAFSTISNYFKMKNITSVDAIIISHMHTDHVNGLEKYLENYKVGIILYSKPFEETKVYDEFKEIVEKYNINVKEVSAGEKYSFGNIIIEVLLPENKMLEETSDLNSNSLICKINIDDKSIIYMGDGTNITEQKLLKLYDLKNVDILKVGHHGSKTSTTNEYIEVIHPKYAVISAKSSYYNHPHKSVLETLNKYNISIYMTEKTGAIKFDMYNF